MNRLIPILCVILSLAACSGPDSSGGVALSKDPYPTNADFPHGQCNDTHAFAQTNTGCGWVYSWDSRYYIEPGANLAGANLSGTTLGSICTGYTGYTACVRLSRANLNGADLTYTDLTNADLYRADLSGANLYFASLSGASLYGADLSDADLSYASLDGANLNRANLTGANLTGARGYSSTVCPNGDFWGTAGNDCGF